MKKILLIGIGPGHPDYLTMQAVKALRTVDVFFFLEKEGRGKEALIAARDTILAEYADAARYRKVFAQSPPRSAERGYTAGVRDWYDDKARIIAGLINDQLADGETGAFLIWGDPSLYDGTLTILQDIERRELAQFDYAIIPGITSVQALAEKHRLTLNRIGESITISTPRNLANMPAADIHNTVVMLDSNAAFEHIDDARLDIYWAAYLGADDEMLAAGDLRTIGPELAEKARQARAEKGWLFDIYLLRRRNSDAE
ncbi:precorrin-6A synthase (deacetylating) [Rhodocyclus tenuis]|uniref:Precorrin-6A synthase (Deacetylating) n=1 Tax=Rhodocyclus gracilis TaxID=2929842 RepID=A0ABX0WLX5_9RHOO|nr:precorrin-6A synthase (deacetylating) [Rhodocyclus gracilis]NJA89767.1 precorrin-6A synthase (deacetylating) [Rhodocyclus gracilis]